MEKKNDDFQKALNYAKKLIRFRSRSRKEMEEKLILKGFHQDIIQRILELLEKSGYVDDEKFAYLYAYDMLTVHGYGPYRIKSKLKELKVEDYIIDDALERIMKEVDLFQIMEKTVKLHRIDRKKIGDFLYRRGFPGELIRMFDIEGGANR